ncbi:hypothetical protein ACFLT7_01940 [candidate division KSB1 bacterium]
MERLVLTRFSTALITGAMALSLALPGCAGREPLESDDKADVRPLGDPVMSTLAYGIHRIWTSFGGPELILVDPSWDYDQEHIDKLCGGPFKICRYADALWEGLVKNHGGAIAESVYVRIKFAGGFIDSAYAVGMNIQPNQTAAFMVYTRGTRVDSVAVLWYEEEEDG